MTITKTRPEFDYEITDHGLGYNAPQKMGRRLWAPMFIMAIMAFPVGLVLSWVRAAEIASSDGDPELVAQLGHLVPAFMFVGFLAVFAAISFAIARILGSFRKGGGEVQETIGSDVETLKMPVTGKIFMAFMMMGMMVLVISVILHFVAAGSVGLDNLEQAEDWAVRLEAFRRLGVGLYLFGIAFGLGTIIHVLRFQAIRIRGLAGTS
jgi:hypothetical protein